MFSKKRFKMFKSGKLWCYAAILFGSLALGAVTTANSAQAAVVASPTTTNVVGG